LSKNTRVPSPRGFLNKDHLAKRPEGTVSESEKQKAGSPSRCPAFLGSIYVEQLKVERLLGIFTGLWEAIISRTPFFSGENGRTHPVGGDIPRRRG
jgi:hypothetical protein